MYEPIVFRYSHIHTLHSAVADIMYLNNLSNHIATGYKRLLSGAPKVHTPVNTTRLDMLQN